MNLSQCSCSQMGHNSVLASRIPSPEQRTRRVPLTARGEHGQQRRARPMRRCPTVTSGHLENRDPAAMHRFLGVPWRSGTAMHHFLNGMPRLTQSHFRRACFCVNHKTSGSRPSRSEASHFDFPLEIASEAFNLANFFAARPSSHTISYPETGKCVAPFLNVRIS